MTKHVCKCGYEIDWFDLPVTEPPKARYCPECKDLTALIVKSGN